MTYIFEACVERSFTSEWNIGTQVLYLLHNVLSNLRECSRQRNYVLISRKTVFRWCLYLDTLRFLNASAVVSSPSKPVMPFADWSKMPGSRQFEPCLVVHLLSWTNGLKKITIHLKTACNWQQTHVNIIQVIVKKKVIKIHN